MKKILMFIMATVLIFPMTAFAKNIGTNETISNGIYHESIINNGTISGGTFSGDAFNNGRNFQVNNYGTISGGTFNIPVTNQSNGIITDGTFKGNVTNNGTITGGSFNGNVTGSGTISGGDFTSATSVSNTLKITGGTFKNIVNLNLTDEYEAIDNGNGTKTVSIKKFTVTFVDYNNSTIGEVQTIDYGNDATAPTDIPTPIGYHFTGWDTTFDKITDNLTVTALYEINTYTVKFYDYNGTLLDTKTVDHGTSATIDEPTREGYTFTGWDTDFTSVTDNLEITALYEPIQYEFILGMNSLYNNQDMTFKINGPASLLQNVYINGTLLDSKYYTIKEGRTIIVISNDYLKTLKNGNYTITAEYTNETSAETTFTVNQITPSSLVDNPQTLDEIIIYTLYMIISIFGILSTRKLAKENN